MCGRYYIKSDDGKMSGIIDFEEYNSGLIGEAKTGEIFPTDIVPVITLDKVLPMKWGYTRYDGKGHIINARSETVLDKPLFRQDFIERRCLVPASYYFEWEKTGSKKVRHAFRLPDSHLLYMAGIYRIESSSPLPSFVILTKDATPAISHIHNRMPVIVASNMLKPWLMNGISEIRFGEQIVFEKA